MTDWWSSDKLAEDRAPVRITVRPQGASQEVQTWWDSDPAAPPGYLEDVARSAGSGLVRGAAGLIGLPELVSRYGAKGIEAATNYVGGKLGIDTSRGDRKPLVELPSTEKLIREYEADAGPLYKPQYKSGEFAQTIGESIPSAIAGPGAGAGAVLRNIAAFGVVPGVVSEAAGQATKGTMLETPARIGGAVAGGGAAALLTRPSRAAATIRSQMPVGVTTQMVDQAEQLIMEAAQRGITLSWPEALSQVAGRPVLTNTMRHLEASPSSEARMAEFFGPRAQQVDQAAGQAFNTVTPAAPNPSVIGPAVGTAAEGTINDVRGVINQATEPFYQAAGPQRLPPQVMAQVRAHPSWPEARDAVRNDPQLNRYVANLPDDSVGFLNEVMKYTRQQAENATRPLAQNPNMQRAAGYGQDAASFRQIGINASPEYQVALNVQEQTRRQFLEPLLQGPLGKLADKDITTRNAINALFSNNPLPNSAQEIETAVRAMAQRNPDAARNLVRAHMESVFNESSQALQSGANQAGGAKFRAVLVGNPQQAANLEAAVRALPNGDQIWPGINRFLDVLEATGTRQNKGSMTAYNTEFLKEQSASGVVAETAKAVTNPVQALKFIADRYERWQLGQNLDELARIFTDPRAAGQFRAIARMSPESGAAGRIAFRLVSLIESGSVSGRAKPVDKPGK